jgi:hypothetical protein
MAKTQTLQTKPVTSQQIRSWMNRHRTRPNPSPAYLEWLRRQYHVTCIAEVIKGKRNETHQ